MYRYNAQTICLNNYESYDAEKKVKKELKSIVREYSEQPYECDPSYLNMVDKRGCQKEIEEEFCPARFYLDINQGSIITEIKVTQFVVFENVFPQKIPIPYEIIVGYLAKSDEKSEKKEFWIYSDGYQISPPPNKVMIFYGSYYLTNYWRFFDKEESESANFLAFEILDKDKYIKNLQSSNCQDVVVQKPTFMFPIATDIVLV